MPNAKEADEYVALLKQKLLAHGVPHVDLARAAKVCPTQFSRWMTGRVRPGLESMVRLDKALDQVLYG